MLRACLPAALLASWLCTLPARAQESETGPTAEEMIETAREAYRPSGLRSRCVPSTGNEIVVCAPGSDAFRVESPTNQAIRTGTLPPDSIPRAPDVNGLGPCAPVCIKMGAPPPQVHLIDLSKIPVPLTGEEARNVYRAEDRAQPVP